MTAPGHSCAEVVAKLAAGGEAEVLHDLARLAVFEEGALVIRLTELWEHQSSSAEPVEEFLEEAHGEQVLQVTLPLVAYGSAFAHRAVGGAVSHLARRTTPRRSGMTGYLYAGHPVIGRLVWALVAQALATGRLDFLSVLARVQVPPSSGYAAVGAARDRRLRHPASLHEDNGRAFEHYRDWLGGRGFLSDCAPYLAADIDDSVATADLVLALAFAGTGRSCFSAGLRQETAVRVAGLVVSEEDAIGSFLGLAAPLSREEVIQRWDQVRGPGHDFDRPRLGTLLDGGAAD